MPTQIQRSAGASASSVAFAADVANSDTLCLSTVSAFSIIVPPGTLSNTVEWYASNRDEGPYYPVIQSNGSAATTSVVASKAIIAPPELFACMYVRGVAGVPFSATVVFKT